MNELERMVWAAAYAAEFTERGRKTIDDISGFSCAEVADVAVEKLREALTVEDAQYLYPVAEGWAGGDG